MKFEVQGEREVRENLQKQVQDVIIAKMKRNVDRTGKFLLVEVKRKASLTDHTQEQLDALHHPYSLAHPHWQEIHDDNAQVHIQSGDLIEHIKMASEYNNQYAEAAVGVNDREVPYIEELDGMHRGSPKMVPRPFISRTWEEHEDDVKQMMKE